MASPLKTRITETARDAGFDVVRFTTPDAIGPAGERLSTYLANGWHGTMDWLITNSDRRADPGVLWPDTRSIILLGMNYGPDADPLALLNRPDTASVSVYARGDDYHDVVKKRLKQVARWLHQSEDVEVKVFVDTAPVMEKPLAEAAGLGWQGKHTNLVSQDFGSWLFIGSIFTTAQIESDVSETDHCGSCRKCLDVCPTDAFPAPYQLDARRCISYLTIEHKGHIPVEFRAAIGNRVYGCDDCLAVCPWNKFASLASEQKLAARDSLRAPSIADMLGLDDPSFRALFSKSPVKRIGRDRFVRNVLIAAGNSNRSDLSGKVETLLRDPAPVVRAMAVWALAGLVDQERFARLETTHAAHETDAGVLSEWSAASQR